MSEPGSGEWVGCFPEGKFATLRRPPSMRLCHGKAELANEGSGTRSSVIVSCVEDPGEEGTGVLGVRLRSGMVPARDELGRS